jgi:hypothetical protein
MATPDPWQQQVLHGLLIGKQHVLINCSRGAGKSQVVSYAAYLEACAGGKVIVFSRSDRQAREEILAKVLAYHRTLGLVRQTRRPTTHDLQLASGGRVLALPCSADTVVGKHRVSLLVIDEAAKVPDAFYARVTPMIATCGGRLCLLSTPFGQRGFFWKEWAGKGRQNWLRIGPVTWQHCPRITREHIEAERASHGTWWVEQEYEAKFQAEVGKFFGDVVDNFDRMIDPHMELRYS